MCKGKRNLKDRDMEGGGGKRNRCKGREVEELGNYEYRGKCKGKELQELFD